MDESLSIIYGMDERQRFAAMKWGFVSFSLAAFTIYGIVQI